MKDFYSPKEVARILNVHVKTVRRYLRDGTIKGQKIGGSWKVSAEEIEQQLHRQVTDEVNEARKFSIEGEEKIRCCLTVEVDIASPSEANSYAEALMAVINSNKHAHCKFQYNLEGATAKFVLSGSGDYIGEMLKAIETVEGDRVAEGS